MNMCKHRRMKLAAVVLGLLMLLMTLAGCGTAAETGADSTGSSQAVTETAAETDADTGTESSQDEMFTDRQQCFGGRERGFRQRQYHYNQ